MTTPFLSGHCRAGSCMSCPGTVLAYDSPDGPSSYLCEHRCHVQPRKVTCSACQGEGTITTTEWSNAKDR